MTILMSALKVVLSAILAVANLIVPTMTEGANQPFAPVDAENCLLNFYAISDTHIRRGDYDYSQGMCDFFLPGMAAAEIKPDALVITGDITHDGNEEDWEFTKEILSQYDLADQILLSVGNHDTWTDEDQAKDYKELFKEYNRKITGKKLSDIYYSTKINGYSFIFLASEDDGTDAYFSNKQIKWLKKEMKKAAKAKKPIFVISHWPFNETHGLPVTFGEDDYDSMTGGIGEQSEKIRKILNKYKDVYFISGHIHSGFSNAKMAESNGFQSIEKYGNITSVNLPSVGNMGINGHFLAGTGYCVEVYKDKIMFRARNFATETWLTGYDYTFAIK